MQRVLTGYEPERVWYYFEELSRIPRGSGNMEAVSSYCARFAEQHSLRCIRDESCNVIIFKPASPGYEESPAVILQGHLDMVAEKTPESDHDFTSDPLDLFTEDGWIGARGTTLGGDDGIAVAYMLALLESDDLPHPALECIFTTDEETGMNGARSLDTSVLSGRYLINMDSEAEGILWTSCAGGLCEFCTLPVERKEMHGLKVHLEVTGLRGGHSGTEIGEGRGNAVILMGRLLYEVSEKVEISIAELAGGEKDNAIPSLCTADILISADDEENLRQAVSEVEKELKDEYQVKDPSLRIVCRSDGEGSISCVRPTDALKILFLLNLCPDGVQSMSQFIDGLVETSLNLGIMNLREDSFFAVFSIRSSVRSRRRQLSEKLEFLCGLLGGDSEASAEYPEWKYRPDSKLRTVVCDVYREMTGSEMKIEAVHAGLECGMFDDKIPDLDIVSIGPDMRDIHTPAERLSLASSERTWKMLCEILKRLK